MENYREIEGRSYVSEEDDDEDRGIRVILVLI